MTHALKIRRDYGILLLFCLAISAVQWILETTGASLPFLGGLLASFLSAYLAVIEAHPDRMDSVPERR